MELVLRGPYRFVVRNWHIDFTPIYHDKSDFQDVLGRSLLSLAASESEPEVLELLLREGAEVDCKDLRTLETPLMAAIRRNDCSIVNLLLKHGASMALLNSDGLHAIQVAVLFATNLEIADLLITPNSGLLDAPAGEGPYKGMSALELALQRRITHIRDYNFSIATRYAHSLLKAGARFKGLEYLIVRPWLEPNMYRLGIPDNGLAMLTDFFNAGLDPLTVISHFSGNIHQYETEMTIEHALSFHSSEPGMASFLARLLFRNVLDGKNSFLYMLCAGCSRVLCPTVEADVRAGIEICLERYVPPHVADGMSQAPLIALLNSISWFDTRRGHPTRLTTLHVMLKYVTVHDSGPIMEALKSAETADDEKKAYIFDVVCLLLQHFSSDVRDTPCWPNADFWNYFPITTQYQDYRDNSPFHQSVVSVFYQLPATVDILRRAAESIAMQKFLSQQLRREKRMRDYRGIWEVLTQQQRNRMLPGGKEDAEAALPRAFVVDILELLVDEQQKRIRNEM